ncbi:hypothetical protein FB567DRAFT_585730 [Paraphoma chrysanthemicola]|uniref:Metalloendopeptidase n=1 Tax=Paraphoma chrysanthemicola TaxID=798071 RepID=A0A8K0RFG7_9PLEO|nr:hypothetical protein FB567DRAFT_585730 [Paraphoma chrysanthemicola]
MNYGESSQMVMRVWTRNVEVSIPMVIDDIKKDENSLISQSFRQAQLKELYLPVQRLEAWRLAENDTLLDEIIAQHKANPHRCSAHVVGGIGGSSSPVAAWPANNEGYTQIPVCYVNADIRDKISRIVNQAHQKWINKLGSAGATNGHRYSGLFETLDNNGKGELCYTDRQQTLWNRKVRSDSLRIDMVLRTQNTRATRGYLPREWKNSIYRHRMDVGWMDTGYDETLAIHSVAHELGHVFGLVHEHQRSDRDQYVHFRCEHLAGYQEASRIVSQHPGLTMEILCASIMLSNQEPWRSLSFMPYDWSIEPYFDRWPKDANGLLDGHLHRWTVLHSRPYDLDSIMHYHSAEGSNLVHGEATVQNAPVVKWKGGKEGFKPPKAVTDLNAEIIRPNTLKESSGGDVEAIRMLYPWGR